MKPFVLFRSLVGALRVVALLGASLALCGVLFGTASAAIITERLVAPGTLDRPVYLTAPPGDRQRVFILEQHLGNIRILNLSDNSINATPFLTLGDLATGNEQGLLGMAFHPNYAQNGFFYVSYTRSGGDSVISRFHVVSPDDDVAVDSETILLEFTQPQANHNGGWIGFGPNDGYLYISSGDGGGADDNDPGHDALIGNGQDTDGNFLGKMLRIDVDGDEFPMDANRNYAIPASNPFANTAGDDEIWAYGLRNPWRASFDRGTGDLYIGDVGQDNREEIDVQPALATGGANYGWRLREGLIATPTPPGNAVGGEAPGAIEPIFEYPHSGAALTTGCSITGGYVYRGPAPELQGRYFFIDYCRGHLLSVLFDGSDPEDFNGQNFTDFVNHDGDPAFTPDAGSLGRVGSFGEDDRGNLYVMRLGTVSQNAILFETGEVFRIPEPSAAALAWGGLGTLAALAARRRRATRNQRGANSMGNLL